MSYCLFLSTPPPGYANYPIPNLLEHQPAASMAFPDHWYLESDSRLALPPLSGPLTTFDNEMTSSPGLASSDCGGLRLDLLSYPTWHPIYVSGVLDSVSPYDQLSPLSIELLRDVVVARVDTEL